VNAAFSATPFGAAHAALVFGVHHVLGAMGIGLVNPIVPYLAERFAAQRDLALVLSVLAISYLGAAFLAAPALGALSDRLGAAPSVCAARTGRAC
jgi:DHA1 family tetracycline resistance protein-like MFS transporter